MFCPHFVQLSNSVSKRAIRLFHYCLPPQFQISNEKIFKTTYLSGFNFSPVGFYLTNGFYSPLPLLKLLWNKILENYWKLLKLIVNDCNKSRFELLEYTPRVHFLRHLWNERAERYAGFSHWAAEVEVEPTLRKSEQMLSLSKKILENNCCRRKSWYEIIWKSLSEKNMMKFSLRKISINSFKEKY